MLFPAQYTPPLSENFPTDGDRLIELIELAYKDLDNTDGVTLDEWQKWLIRALLERYPDTHPDPDKAGRRRWRSVCVSLPRQSGKSLIASAIALDHLLWRSGQCLGIASNLEQSFIIYGRVLQAIQANPALQRRFKKATERRGIVATDGMSRYDVRAARESSLQGYPVTTAIGDELHLWGKGLWTALQMAIASKEDGIIIGITTAGDETSETLIDLYAQGKRAIEGDPELERFGFFNWTAPDGADVKDPAAILASNPAVECGRIPLDRIMADLATIPEHEARRYRLNQFITGTQESWLPAEYFHACSGTGIANLEGITLGIDVTPRWEFATIAAANDNGDITETELVQSFVKPTENQLYEAITDYCRRFKVKAIGIDGSRTPNLIKRLKLGGYPVWQLYNREVSAACSQGYSMFEQKHIRHNNDPLLIAQSPRAVAKYTGESWYLSPKASFGDIDAVRATLFAVYVCVSKETSSIGVF